MRKTKIICTLGPASSDEKTIRRLMKSGMDVARFNFSHSTHEEHQVLYERVDKIRKELGLPIATLLDTKGPEIRIGTFTDGKVVLKKNGTFTLTTRDVPGTPEIVSVSYHNLPNDIQDGSRILIDDGLIELKVTSHNGTDIVCHIENGGEISNRKGVNVPGARLSMPYLSAQDKSDLAFGAKMGFDYVAASFTRCAEDVESIRALLAENHAPDIRIIAKIENSDGIENIDEIIDAADGVMVARGDMGVEVPCEDIPVFQKMIIKKATFAGKQVVTATQMLDSMIKNPRPTRAEINDVANAIYDGTSAIMLSGETAAGLYPVESLQIMALIAKRTESDIDYAKRFRNREISNVTNITTAISHATVTTSIDLKAAAILTVTKTGQTARMISKCRPKCPIICGTTSERVWRQANLYWGIIPIMIQEQHTNDALFEHAVHCAKAQKLLKDGDLVVITAGVPLGVAGTTNIMKVHIVGDILATGKGIGSHCVSGPLCVCTSEAQAHHLFQKGDILVLPKTSNGVLDLIKDCAGIVTEQGGDNSHAAVAGPALGKPVIVGAQNATSILRSGTIVALDEAHGIICSIGRQD